MPPLSTAGFLGWCTSELSGQDACAGDLLTGSDTIDVQTSPTTLWAAWGEVIPAPTFDELTLASAAVGQPYDQAIPLSGRGPITCALDPESVLPAGLSLSEQCHLTGTPTTTGQHTFWVAATNQGGTTTEELSLEIGAAPTPTPTPTEPTPTPTEPTPTPTEPTPTPTEPTPTEPTPSTTAPTDELAHTGNDMIAPLTGLALALAVAGIGLLLGRRQLGKR